MDHIRVMIPGRSKHGEGKGTLCACTFDTIYFSNTLAKKGSFFWDIPGHKVRQ
jgi:hypothetical protein